VWSASVSARLRLLLQPGLRSDYTATIFEDDDTAPGSPVAETAEGADGSRVRSAAELDEVVAKIAATGLTPRCVVAASELGVEFADQLAMHMGLPNNGTALSDCRRDKFAMGERVRAAGVRAVKQRLCSTWEEAHAFLLECGVPDADTAAEHALDRALEGPAASGALRMVIKPARSGGSDDVFLCSHMAEFREKFHHIIGKKVRTPRSPPHSQPSVSLFSALHASHCSASFLSARLPARPPARLRASVEQAERAEHGSAAAGVPAGRRVRHRHCLARRPPQARRLLELHEGLRQWRRLRLLRHAAH
jgi:hypothetical protein